MDDDSVLDSLSQQLDESCLTDVETPSLKPHAHDILHNACTELYKDLDRVPAGLKLSCLEEQLSACITECSAKRRPSFLDDRRRSLSTNSLRASQAHIERTLSRLDSVVDVIEEEADTLFEIPTAASGRRSSIRRSSLGGGVSGRRSSVGITAGRRSRVSIAPVMEQQQEQQGPSSLYGPAGGMYDMDTVGVDAEYEDAPVMGRRSTYILGPMPFYEAIQEEEEEEEAAAAAAEEAAAMEEEAAYAPPKPLRRAQA